MSEAESTSTNQAPQASGRPLVLGIPREARAKHGLDDPPSTPPATAADDGASPDPAVPAAKALTSSADPGSTRHVPPAATAAAGAGAVPQMAAASSAAPVHLPALAAPRPLPPRLVPLADAVIDATRRCGLKLTLSTGRRLSAVAVGTGRMSSGSLTTPPSAWWLLDAGLPTPGVLLVDDMVALRLADVLLGGSGTASPGRTRPERVEVAVLARHLVRTFTPLAEAMAPYGVTGLALGNPPLAATPASTLGGTEVFAVRIQIALADAPLDGAVLLAVPYRPLCGTGEDGEVDDAAGSPQAALSAVPVDVVVRFPGTTIAAAELAGLEPGDVLRLDMAVAADTPRVVGTIDGLRVLAGQLGRSGRQRAIVVGGVDPVALGGVR